MIIEDLIQRIFEENKTEIIFLQIFSGQWYIVITLTQYTY